MALDKLKTDMITDGTIVDADVSGIAASKLTGALPAISGTNLTNLDAADLVGALPAISGAALTGVATDVSSIQQDILTLALHSAVTDNKAAFNLPGAFIDQFEDDTGLLTQTTVDRDSSGEYVSTIGGAVEDSNTKLLLHMNDTGLTDDSATGHTMYATGNAARSSTQSKFGGYSMYLDGNNTTIPMIRFDTNDKLTAAANVHNLADSKVGTIAFWMRKKQDGAYLELIELGSSLINIRFNDTNKFRVYFAGAKGAWYTNSTLTIADGLTHVIVGWDVANDKKWILFNGVAQSLTVNNALVNSTISHNAVLTIGKSSDTYRPWNSEIGQFYWSQVYTDFDVQANIDKFYKSGPIDYGANGSGPSGTQPQIFLNNATATWQNNLGAGGNFTETGALANAGANQYSGSWLRPADHADWDMGTGDYSMEAWIYPTGDGSSNHAFLGSAEWGGHAAQSFLFDLTPTNPPGYRFMLHGGQGTLNYLGGATIPLNTWTHMAVSLSGNTYRVFKNGTIITATTNNLGGTETLTSHGSIMIGARGGAEPWLGYIDEVRISKGVARWTANFTAPTSAYGLTTNATGTLISNAQTALAATTSLSGVFLYTDTTGTATIGTDLKIYMSANNGTNFTEAASYSTAQTFSGSVKMVRLGKTTVTSGTQVKLKAVWANQASGSKVTRLNGWAINY